MQSQTSNIDDSWFWESEKTQSSTSSKENETISSTITTVVATNSAAAASAAHSAEKSNKNEDDDRIVEKLRRALEEKDIKLQQLIDENVSMNDKIKQLHQNGFEIEKNIEQLDQQHNIEMESMIDIRNELQLKIDHLEKLLSNEAEKSIDLESKLSNAFDENQQIATKSAELEKIVNEKCHEIKELNKILEVCDVLDVKDKKSPSPTSHQQELEEIKGRLSILNDVKAQYDANVQRLSAVVDEKAQLEKLMTKLQSDNEKLLHEVQVTREAVEKLEILQHTLDEINAEKDQNEQAFGALQEDELLLQREYQQMKVDNEKLTMELETNNNSQKQLIISLEEKCELFELQLKKLQSDYDEMLTKQLETETARNELQTAYDDLKSEASDLESRLVEENMIYQKKIIDTQNLLDQKQHSHESSHSDSNISILELQKLIFDHLNYSGTDSNGNETPIQYFSTFLSSIKELQQHLVEIEKNRDELMEKFEQATKDRKNLQHECETLQADLHHYETEVNELMKNNGILLNELEKLKNGKLETISEQNEDNILRLEKQIEDYSKLNQSLEDEYENLQHRLEEREEEKYELLEKIAHLEEKLDMEQKNVKSVRAQWENTELARTNVQLQLDQMISNESVAIEYQKKFDEKQNEIDSLNAQLEHSGADQSELVNKIKPLQDEKNELISQVENLQQLISKNKIESAKLQSKITEFENSIKEDATNAANLEEKIRTLELEKDNYVQECDRLAKLIEEEGVESQSTAETEIASDLRKQIEKLQSQHASAIQELKNVIDVLNKEKHELVIAIQLKHNENLQYHAKIQELTAALTAMQSQQCQNCDQINGQLTSNKAKINELIDQIEFLKEKSDIMMKNVLIEQSNQKLLQQEKAQLIEEKQQIGKDLERLREHLIQMEEAHTQEMIEMEKMLNETSNEMTVMQEEARKSSTAYTSAR